MIYAGIFLFYFLFLVFAIEEEGKSVTRPAEKIKRKMRYRKFKEGEEEKLPAEFLVPFLYNIFIIVGILSSQWVFFLILYLTGFIPKKTETAYVMDGIFSLSIIFLIILNRFHLHINLTEYLLSFFQ